MLAVGMTIIVTLIKTESEMWNWYRICDILRYLTTPTPHSEEMIRYSPGEEKQRSD